MLDGRLSFRCCMTSTGGMDESAAGGPGGFADLAEKVEPAVVGVIAKVAVSRQSMRGQGLKPGSPDDGDMEDQDIPMPRSGTPDHGEGPKAKPHEAMTI